MTAYVSDDGYSDILEPEVVPMTKTLVDVDDALLARAQELLRTATKKDTINRALELVVADQEQWEALNEEIARGESGFYSRLLTDPDIPWNR
jgi:Arc/MetJ family transcription regulator